MPVEWSKFDERGLARYVIPEIPASFQLAPSVNRLELIHWLDYQQLLKEIYNALIAKNIKYALEPFNTESNIQKIRTPKEILENHKEGTCLDLAILFCGICLAYDLLPLLIVLDGHALVAVSMRHQRKEYWESPDGEREEVRKLFQKIPLNNHKQLSNLIDCEDYLPVECTGFVSSFTTLSETMPEAIGRTEEGFLSFERAIEAGKEQLNRLDRQLKFALDVAIAHEYWKIKPLVQETAITSLHSSEIPSNLPFSDPAKFVGREEDLVRLRELIASKGKVAICTTGMGGVGKTELVLQYGRQYLYEYPGGICWVFARGQNIGTQLIAFASRHISGLKISEDMTLTEQVRACFEQWLPGRVLFIFDDIDNLATVRHLLPGAERFRVIFTSREKLLSRVERLELEVLSRKASLELLAVLEGGDRVEANPIEADALCQWLGDLPLGLQLAGRYLERKPDLSLEEMLARLQDEGLLERALSGRQDDRSQQGVAAAFQLSWEQLSLHARQVLGVMGLFATAPIFWELVEAIWDEGLAENWRDEELLYAHLVERVGFRVYRLHSLVREFVHLRFAELPDCQHRQQEFARVLVKEAEYIEQRMTRQDLTDIAPLIPHVAELAESGKEWLTEEQWIVPFTRLGWFNEGIVNYEAAEQWYKNLRESTAAFHGLNHVGYSTALNNLAQLYQARGQLEQALPFAQEALERDRQNLSSDHPNIAINLSNLACIYKDLGMLDEALPFALEALKLDRQNLPPNHPNITVDLNVLAVLYERKGDYENALSLQKETLERGRQYLPEDHPDITIYLNNLALLYRDSKQYKEAISLLKEALDRGRNSLPENHPSIATRLYNLALLYRNLKQYDEALVYANDALERDRQNLPPEHPDIGLDLTNLACLYRDAGKPEKAISLFREALLILQQALPPKHPDVKMVQQNLADLV